MVAFAKRLLHSFVYGGVIGLILSMMDMLIGYILTAIGALPSSLSPGILGAMGFGVGFLASVAIAWTKDIEPEEKQ